MPAFARRARRCELSDLQPPRHAVPFEPSSAALARLPREALGDPSVLLSTEWLEADGLGGFAGCTPPLCPTRREHGLLVAIPAGHSRRHVFLARCDEVLHGAHGSDALSLARYAGTWAPRGDRALERFELAPWPRASYRVGEGLLVREVLRVRGAPVVLVRWSLEGPLGPARLELRPLLACRAADALTRENPGADPALEHLPGGFAVRPYPALPRVALTFSDRGVAVHAEPVWYRALELAEDLRQGRDGHEDQLAPARVELVLEEGGAVVMAASLDAPVEDPADLWERESTARRAVVEDLEPDLWTRLDLAADDVLARAADDRLGVLATLPAAPDAARVGERGGAGELGVDLFASLPGLLLARGRLDECGEALRGACERLRDGLMPEVLGAGPSDDVRGAVEPGLWFAHAVRRWAEAGARAADVRALRPALEEVAGAIADGAHGGRADEEGLLVTVRDGREVSPVDGCALWYELLAQLEELSGASARARWKALRRRARRAFAGRFWIDAESRLAERWGDGRRDPTPGPGGVLAASLADSPLTRVQRAGVVEHARAHLLTVRGLRDAPGGPARPATLGAFCEAALHAGGPRKKLLAELSERLAALAPELDRAALGHVSERFDGADGTAPGEPAGAPVHARTTAELLRAGVLLDRARG